MLENVFLTTSCTSALEMGHLAGIVLVIKYLTFYTFSSTVNCIINYGAFQFCEINPKAMNIDSEKIESLITEKLNDLPIDYAGISCELIKSF